MDYTVTVLDDLSTLTPDDAYALVAELDAHLAAVMQAKQRVSAVAYAPVQVAVQQQAYHEAVDGPDPEVDPDEPPADPLQGWPSWRQPLGGHDAYPQGMIRQHNGKLWENTRTSNVWEPGTPDSGWVEVALDGDDDPEPPDEPVADPWVEGATYAVGDLAAYEGTVYRCVQAHTADVGAGWTPAATPSLWTPAA